MALQNKGKGKEDYIARRANGKQKIAKSIPSNRFYDQTGSKKGTRVVDDKEMSVRL